jgi:hypothetical protein
MTRLRKKLEGPRWTKISGACEKTKEHSLDWFRVHTNCFDKSISTGLNAPINYAFFYCESGVLFVSCRHPSTTPFSAGRELAECHRRGRVIAGPITDTFEDDEFLARFCVPLTAPPYQLTRVLVDFNGDCDVKGGCLIDGKSNRRVPHLGGLPNPMTCHEGGFGPYSANIQDQHVHNHGKNSYSRANECDDYW